MNAAMARTLAVIPSGWATPAAQDWRDGRASEETMAGNARPLNEQAVMLAGWATPRANKWGEPDSHGKTAFGCPASTEKRGALNPLFPLWLILGSGELARVWASYAPQATRSSHKPPLPSSKP
jgi:hypothetical protein